MRASRVFARLVVSYVFLWIRGVSLVPDDFTLDKSFECSIRVRTAAMKAQKNFGGF